MRCDSSPVQSMKVKVRSDPLLLIGLIVMDCYISTIRAVFILESLVDIFPYLRLIFLAISSLLRDICTCRKAINTTEEKSMSRAQGDAYRTHTDHELNAYKARLDAKLRKLIDHKEKWYRAGAGWILCQERNRMTNPNGSWKWKCHHR